MSINELKTRSVLFFAVALLPGLSSCKQPVGEEGFVHKGADGVITLSVGAMADLAEPMSEFKLEDQFEEIGLLLSGDDPRTFLRGEEVYAKKGYALAVCDLKSRRLVHYSASRGEEPFAHMGIPYERDGRTLFLEPVFAEHDLLICREEMGGDVFYCFRLKI